MNAPDLTSDWAKARLATPAGQIERSMLADLEWHLPEGWRLATAEEADEIRRLPVGVVVFDEAGDPHAVSLPVQVDWLLPRDPRVARAVGLDDPDREAKLARLRAEMVAGNEGGVTRWPGGGSDV